jgi:hypothetical protein
MFKDVKEEVYLYKCDKCGKEESYWMHGVCYGCLATYCYDCHDIEMVHYENYKDGADFMLCRKCADNPQGRALKLLVLAKKRKELEGVGDAFYEKNPKAALSNTINALVGKLTDKTEEEYHGSFIKTGNGEEVLLRSMSKRDKIQRSNVSQLFEKILPGLRK